MTTPDRRWPWWFQVRDFLTTALGIGVIITMTWRDSWPPLGVATALVCVGSLSASALLRYLVGRWEKDGERK